jgi:hypothetical protein
MNNIQGFKDWAALYEERKNLRFGCVMLNLDFPGWDRIIKKIEENDIYREENEYGIEKDPHVTVLYGLHNDIPDSVIEERISKMSSPKLRLENISIFENDDKKYDVVKFDVEGEGLHEMNKMFAELPHTNDYPKYNPHSTICYVKKGTGKKYIQKLSEPIEINPSHVIYSKSDETKKKYPLL